MAARISVQVPIDPQQVAEFDRALELLRELVDWSAADRAGIFWKGGRGAEMRSTSPAWCCGCSSRSG